MCQRSIQLGGRLDIVFEQHGRWELQRLGVFQRFVRPAVWYGVLIWYLICCLVHTEQQQWKCRIVFSLEVGSVIRECHCIKGLWRGVLITVQPIQEGSNFFNGWEFFTDSDPTHGTVQYVDQATAVRMIRLSIDLDASSLFDCSKVPTLRVSTVPEM